MAKKQLGVVFGSSSSEHEVSLASAKNVLNAVDREKYDVIEMGILKDGRWVTGDGALAYLTCCATPELLPAGMDEVILEAAESLGVSLEESQDWSSQVKLLIPKLAAMLSITRSRLPEPCDECPCFSDLDVVFPVLHGPPGENGAFQGLCEIAQVPVVGCGVLSSAVSMDKFICNSIADEEEIPQASWVGITSQLAELNLEEIDKGILEQLGNYPVFVKPANAGSSVGISKVSSVDELEDAVMLAGHFDRRILIEEAIIGRELEVAVFGNDELTVSPAVSEIIPEREFYDYEAKYIEDNTRIELPANVPEDVVQRIRDYAAHIFQAVDGCGMARVDFFYREEDDAVLFNEINTIPGFTQISQYPSLMKTAGLDYPTLVDQLITLALERFEENEALGDA